MSRNRHCCKRCRSRWIRHSRKRLLTWALALLGLTAYRCLYCGNRFFRWEPDNIRKYWLSPLTLILNRFRAASASTLVPDMAGAGDLNPSPSTCADQGPPQPSTPSQKHIFCTKCGHQQSARATFCTKCGTRLFKPQEKRILVMQG